MVSSVLFDEDTRIILEKLKKDLIRRYPGKRITYPIIMKAALTDFIIKGAKFHDRPTNN